MDLYPEAKRSEIMAKIGARNTKPEILVRKFLFSKGFRYRVNDKRYPGKPDILLPKYKTVVFVHGCFWHGHNCPAGKLPTTRKEFWEAKIESNIERDIRNTQLLKDMGFKVISIWQCELKNKILLQSTMSTLAKELTNAVQN